MRALLNIFSCFLTLDMFQHLFSDTFLKITFIHRGENICIQIVFLKQFASV
jgi:hypothetical protein